MDGFVETRLVTIMAVVWWPFGAPTIPVPGFELTLAAVAPRGSYVRPADFPRLQVQPPLAHPPTHHLSKPT